VVEVLGVRSWFDGPGDGGEAVEVLLDSVEGAGLGKEGTVQAWLGRGMGEADGESKGNGGGEVIGALERGVYEGREIRLDVSEGGGPGEGDMVDAVRGEVLLAGIPGVVRALVDVGIGLRDEGVGGAEVVV